jgi:phosphoglycolate phosphatase
VTPLENLFSGQLPRLVMFDLDGTLIDSVPDLAAAVDCMLAQLGRPPVGIGKVRDWVGNGSKVLVRRALADQLEHSAVADILADQAHQLFLRAYADCHELSSIYPGVRECLDWLLAHGVAMALVTNKPTQFVAPLLAEKRLAEYFRWILGGDSLPVQKPHPAALQWVLDQAAVQPEQALFVGDSRNDVLAARSAGVPCVAVSYGYNHGRPIEEENPQLVLPDLRQLVDSTRRLG